VNPFFFKLGIAAITSALSFVSFLRTKSKLGIWLLILILPIYTTKFLGKVGDIFTIEFSDVLIVAIVLPLFLREMILGKKFGKTISKEISNIFLVFLIYFSFVFLTIFWTKDVFLTFRQLIIITVFGFLFFVSLLTISRWDRKDLQSTILLILLVGLIIIILGIFQVFFPNFSIIQSAQPGFPTGTFTETNWYTEFLILIGIWSLFTLNSSRKLLKTIGVVNLVFLSVGIYMAKTSTVGIIGYLYLVSLFLVYFLGKSVLKKPVLTISITILIGLILAFPLRNLCLEFITPLEEISDLIKGEAEIAKIRLSQFFVSLQLIKENPFGYGAGTWEPIMKEATDVGYGAFGWVNGILLEQGMLAFIAWIIFIISLFIVIFRALISTKAWEVRAALFSFIWLLIAGLPHPLYYMNFFWFYMSFSIATALVMNRVFIKERMKLNSLT